MNTKLVSTIGIILIGMLLLMGTSVLTNDGSMYIGGNSNGVGTGVPVTNSTVDINVSSATTAQLVAASAGKSIYITHIHVMAAGTTNFSLVYGTGTNCVTGQNTIDGPIPLTAQTGYSAGSGFGAVIVIPSGNALCTTNSQAIQVGGAASVSQF
jgi:hypothetical protein